MQEKLLYFTAGIDIVHVGVVNHFKHHFRMIGTMARFLIKFFEIIKIEIIYNGINYTDRGVCGDIFINFCEKERFG